MAGQTSAGFDVIYGSSVSDAIAGGSGNDLQIGGDGSDTYTYRRGDGDDVVDDSGTFGGTSDQLILEGIGPQAVSFRASLSDAVVVIAESAPGAGDGGSIRIINTLNPYYERGVETIRFGDGTAISMTEVRSAILAGQSTNGKDVLSGFSTGNLYQGGLGDDLATGGEGDDTFVYTRGDGVDVIDDSGDQWRSS